MSQISTSSNAVNRGGSSATPPLSYVGTGAEGNSFSFPALAGKTLSIVSRAGRVLGITADLAPSTDYIQYTPGTTLFTLSAGDIVGDGELFLFYY